MVVHRATVPMSSGSARESVTVTVSPACHSFY